MILLKHRGSAIEPFEWPMAAFPSMRWFDDMLGDTGGDQPIRVEEFTEEGMLVVRAELPGFDSDNDVSVTVDGGVLRIVAERQTEEKDEQRDFHRRELRYGSFSRTLALPEGTDGAAITATSKDGILEVRIPLPVAPAAEPARSIPIAHN